MSAYIKFVFFSVSENGENGLGDEGADGDNAPQNFWARTAPLGNTNKHEDVRANKHETARNIITILALRRHRGALGVQ